MTIVLSYFDLVTVFPSDVVCNKASVAYSYVPIAPVFVADPTVMDVFASSSAVTM